MGTTGKEKVDGDQMHASKDAIVLTWLVDWGLGSWTLRWTCARLLEKQKLYQDKLEKRTL